MREKLERLLDNLLSEGFSPLGNPSEFHSIFRSRNGLWTAVVTKKLAVVEYYRSVPIHRRPKGAPRK